MAIELKEVEAKESEFVLNNGKPHQTETGAFYHYTNVVSMLKKYGQSIKRDMQIKIDKQIEGTAESISYAVANREQELSVENEMLKQDIRMLCGLFQDFEWPKHLFETISNVVMNAEAHAVS